jgi:crossover junction endodeoxyribonuclease RuvC
MDKKIIIGIDPGSRALGFGVIEFSLQGLRALEWGVIRPKGLELAQRLGELHQSLLDLFEKYSPEHIVVEKIFLGKNPDSAFVLGHARGVILAAASQSQAQFSEYATRTVKKAVTGQGGAEKEHVRKVVEALLNIRVSDLDATDALAMAIGHTREIEKQNLLDRQTNRQRGAQL